MLCLSGCTLLIYTDLYTLVSPYISLTRGRCSFLQRSRFLPTLKMSPTAVSTNGGGGLTFLLCVALALRACSGFRGWQPLRTFMLKAVPSRCVSQGYNRILGVYQITPLPHGKEWR